VADAGPAGDGALSALPFRVAHLGNLGCGGMHHEPGLLAQMLDAVNAIEPDLVIVAGDLTDAGYDWEYEEALRQLEAVDAPMVVVPGNRDARNVGYLHYERRFGERFSCRRYPVEGVRAARLGMDGVAVLAMDSSEPDLDTGHIGREWYGWVREQLAGADEHLKLFVLHHHVMAIPGAGRAMNVVTDAGDLLPVLDEVGVDIVLSGHKHVPFFWGLNGMLVANCGTISTRRLRGLVPPSWNELRVDHSTIKVYLHYEDGRRELSAIRSRGTRRLIGESFHITGGFYASNAVPLH
jgi:3',5'-cyclic-AMP phosphodiesterase